MQVQQFQFNPIGENTYVLYDDTKECVIVDPGCFYPEEKEALVKFISDNDLVVKHIINTHLHFDHIFGAHFVEQQYGLQLQAHKADEFLVEEMVTQLQRFGFSGSESLPPTIGTYLDEEDTVVFGKQKLDIFHVPGHSPGSIVFYNADAGYMLVGDVLFRGSVGRTDLEGGSHELLITGIKEKLLSLPATTVVYSGHGPSTTIGDEMQINPYLQ